ncbi:MAG: hypothetical protein CMA15_03420 [Euryarchaeota archaeon]|nr:hypothetical protein [Euryarchaeota archaeon]
MVRETHAYGLPYLDENPFSIRPLEAGESGKLVGREDAFNRLQSFLRLRSARRIMLLGPLGSGRTSLVRCLKPYAGASATIDHLPAQSPATSLLNMCYRQMIGVEPPLDRTQLVNDLVNEMYSFNDKLPMIVIDVPASDLSVLEVALRDAHSSLERLNALLVLVCDVKERHQLPSTVVEGFELLRLSPFSAGDVMTLVRQRLASVGVVDSEFSMNDAAALLDDCDGYPASVITLLRDAVDSIRMGQSQGLPSPFVDTSAKIQPRDEPESLHRLMGESMEETEAHEQEPSLPGYDDGAEVVDAPISDVIDASMPWDQRADLLEQPLSIFDEVEDSLPVGFELDIGKLSEEKDNDEPLQATPFNTPIIDADSARGGPTTPVSGMFKNLARRNKDANLADGLETDDGQNALDELVDDSNQYQYWVNEALMPPAPDEPISEAESTMLLHDEVGFVDDLPQADALPLSDVDQALGHDEGGSQPLSNNAMLEALSGLMAMLQPASNPAPHHEGLLSYLQRRYREREGPREAYALDKHALSSLNPSESYVVSVAHQRTYSPSDEYILGHLSVKRARLSQISNRLLKHGILQVQQVGRSRKYSLTQAARAQLMAWGAVGGDV